MNNPIKNKKKDMARCKVCFRHCEIPEGGLGFCGARTCRDGVVTAANYGRITSLALDPIEKKPLARFHPGAMIVSAGSYGCNLRCLFCQNYQISWSEEALGYAKAAEEPDASGLSRQAEYISPEELAAIAASCRDRGNIGVAFTYNEPLIGYEYIRDTARLVHEAGMKNVLVTAGCVSQAVLEEILPYIDAMNIDLKGFTDKVSYLMISKWGLNAICITANVNAMKLAPKSDDYLYEASNMLKMWSLPLIFAVVYIIIGALLLSLVDRDKR